MASAPPGSVALNGCPAWRLAVTAVAVAALATTIGWALGRGADGSAGTAADGTVGAASAAAALALVASVAVALSAWTLWRCPIGQLAWAGDRWRFEPAPSGGSHRVSCPVEGTISIAVDLGNVLLLILHPDPVDPHAGRLARAAARAFPCWLPVERRAVAGDWHGLRVALAAGRPR